MQFAAQLQGRPQLLLQQAQACCLCSWQDSSSAALLEAGARHSETLLWMTPCSSCEWLGIGAKQLVWASCQQHGRGRVDSASHGSGVKV